MTNTLIELLIPKIRIEQLQLLSSQWSVYKTFNHNTIIYLGTNLTKLYIIIIFTQTRVKQQLPSAHKYNIVADHCKR